MTAPPELRVCYHGAGPVRASAWWLFADGSTSEHVSAVRDTAAEAIAAVRELVGYPSDCAVRSACALTRAASSSSPASSAARSSDEIASRIVS